MRAIKILALGVLGVILLAGVAVGAALGYRIYRQHQNSDALRIHTTNGIEQGMFVSIGGLRQWIQVRGEDRHNPVILFVHGGPAMSMIPFTYRSMQAWEKYFTIVQWDQRGAGRTYVLNGGADETAAGMDQIIDDGIRVSEFTRTLLHKDRIIVLGESWGSAVALEMARTRPDLFYAYVGTGQSVDMPRTQTMTYELLLERVRSEHDEKASSQLVSIGPPPYADASRWMLEQTISADHPAAWSEDGARISCSLRDTRSATVCSSSAVRADTGPNWSLKISNTAPKAVVRTLKSRYFSSRARTTFRRRWHWPANTWTPFPHRVRPSSSSPAEVTTPSSLQRAFSRGIQRAGAPAGVALNPHCRHFAATTQDSDYDDDGSQRSRSRSQRRDGHFEYI